MIRVYSISRKLKKSILLNAEQDKKFLPFQNYLRKLIKTNTQVQTLEKRSNGKRCLAVIVSDQRISVGQNLM